MTKTNILAYLLSVKEIFFSHALDFFFYLLFFFSPISSLLTGVGVLVICDTITGIAAAKKRGEKIRSNLMHRTVVKTTLFLIGIGLAHLMELTFISWLPVTNIVAGYIALSEFKSNMENISEYTGIDIWKNIVNKMHNSTSNKFKNNKNSSNE